MPYAKTPWVREGRVRTASGLFIALDTPAWFAWLHDFAAFGYSCRSCLLRLTLRREQRRHQHYWYGYTKFNAKLHNVYLGKSEQLTHARLEQACQQLWQQVKPQQLPMP
jgi:LuxR family transcriptional regulator, maltose regulon positive regulatory protein